MIVLSARNVCSALQQGMSLVHRMGVPQDSRDGPVLALPFPVTTHHHRPTERVLFSARRDANPFFHLFESMWMLAGSRDGRWLDTYVARFSDRFGGEDGNIDDSYGWRWRHHFGIDQLEDVVEILRRSPNTRQAVLQMWDPRSDLVSGAAKPCNTCAYLRVRERGGERQLDLTVSCRSNDLIMGAHGANAVHFSVLQEYLACRVGVAVGHYWQVSSDYHAYERDLARMGSAVDWYSSAATDSACDLYAQGVVRPERLFDPETVGQLVDDLWTWMHDPICPQRFVSRRLFSELLVPMARAHAAARLREFDEAREWLQEVAHPDWRLAAEEWVARRESRWQTRQGDRTQEVAE
jgi:hypothetical protein